MKRLIYTIIALLTVLPIMAEDVEITYDRLPSKARGVIESVFPDTKVKKVNMERRASLIQYEVKLQGGIKLQFNKAGEFTECECKDTPVPDKLVPARIMEITRKEFPEQKIMRIEHDSKLYELVLDNGYELSFNSSYRLIDVDRAEPEK